MVDNSLKPGTKVKVKVPKAQISYMVKNSKYSYAELKVMIQQILELVLNTTKAELKIFINNIVPKRTGTLRQSLLNWLEGSWAGEGMMELVMGSNIEYAEDVNEMTTSQVRHVNDWGYVYYPNWFGMSSKSRPRGHKKFLLNDPRAQGHFWDKLLEFAKERVDINLIRAKNQVLGNAVKRAKTGAFAVT
jgi:hypothetical protein